MHAADKCELRSRDPFRNRDEKKKQKGEGLNISTAMTAPTVCIKSAVVIYYIKKNYVRRHKGLTLGGLHIQCVTSLTVKGCSCGSGGQQRLGALSADDTTCQTTQQRARTLSHGPQLLSTNNLARGFWREDGTGRDELLQLSGARQIQPGKKRTEVSLFFAHKL